MISLIITIWAFLSASAIVAIKRREFYAEYRIALQHLSGWCLTILGSVAVSIEHYETRLMCFRNSNAREIGYALARVETELGK